MNLFRWFFEAITVKRDPPTPEQVAAWNRYQHEIHGSPNYETYVEEVPLVNGKVVCRFCGSKKIMVDFGAGTWGRRTHFCGTCGKKLYFSNR